MRTPLLLLCLVFSACDSGPSQPDQTPDPTPDPGSALTIRSGTFRASDGSIIAVDRGELLVPEDRSRTGGPTVSLPFVKFRSTSETPGNPVIYLTGGPGDSGLEEASWIYPTLFADLLRTGDVIAFDQRGTGTAIPSLACEGTVALTPEALASEQGLLAAFQASASACAAARSSEGINLQSYTTAASVEDINDLRLALKVPRLKVMGLSYGTHLALALAKKYPDTIERMVLLGVEGLDQTLKLPSNTQRQLEHIAALVQADAGASALLPDFLGSLRSILDRLEASPEVVTVNDPLSGLEVTVEVTKFMVQLVISLNLGFARDIESLPALVGLLEAGDYETFASAVLPFSNFPAPSAMTFMMDCSSGGSQQRLDEIQSGARDSILGDRINLPFPAVCGVWSAEDLGDAFRAPLQASIPTLVVSGTLDGRTPVSNGEEVLAGLPNGSHLILENGGHDTLDDWRFYPEYHAALVGFLHDGSTSVSRISIPFGF